MNALVFYIANRNRAKIKFDFNLNWIALYKIIWKLEEDFPSL
jgi:hypothetical protein